MYKYVQQNETVTDIRAIYFLLAFTLHFLEAWDSIAAFVCCH